VVLTQRLQQLVNERIAGCDFIRERNWHDVQGGVERDGRPLLSPLRGCVSF
jgi:hypothetical protein